MQFRLLGPIGLWFEGRAIELGPARQSCVLAALLTDARPVPTAVLVDRVWGESPPERARDLLYTYVARLRAILRGVGLGIEFRAGRYEIAVAASAVDARWFRSLCERAQSGALDADERVRLYREALELWRGPALDGLSGAWVERTREGLERRWLNAVVACLELELERGRHVEVVDEISDLVAQHPAVEPLSGHLMVALYRAGRQAEALEVYRTIRHVLVEQHGLEPGPELRALEMAILSSDPSLGLPSPSSAVTVVPAGPRPRQLPPEHGAFVGRANELAQVDRLLRATGADRRIVALVGPAGVGKTAFALHVAYRNVDRFPDGQLYLNLRGYDPSAAPMSIAEALRRLLDALLVPADRIPCTFDGQASLYRSLVADRRILVILDNARDADQVRPLLPGGSHGLVMVISRRQLVGLVAVEGAYPVALDVLDEAAARAMLTSRLGGGPEVGSTALSTALGVCGGLPLAIAVVAGRIAADPSLDLTGVDSPLSLLGTPDPAADVRVALSLSYHALTPAAAALFRLIGLHPTPEFGIPAAASLAGEGTDAARTLLSELATSHLVTPIAPGRYAIHDLLHMYARELVDAHHQDGDRRAALCRLIEYHLSAATAARWLLDPYAQPVGTDRAAPAMFETETQARVWFSDHRIAVSALIQEAVRRGYDAHATDLTHAVTSFLGREGHWSEYASNWHVVLDSAQRRSDPEGQALAHGYLARACCMQEDADGARHHFTSALRFFEECEYPTAEVRTRLHLSEFLTRWGGHTEALEHTQRVLDLTAARSDRHWHAIALNTAGWCHAQLGDHGLAFDECTRALRAFEEIGDPHGRAASLDILGYNSSRQGDHRGAIEAYLDAIKVLGELGKNRWQADALTRLGDSYAAVGDRQTALESWHHAAAILDRHEYPDADAIRAKVDAVSRLS